MQTITTPLVGQIYRSAADPAFAVFIGAIKPLDGGGFVLDLQWEPDRSSGDGDVLCLSDDEWYVLARSIA
ncbi:MAG: hypothetical protein Q8O52_08090 [Sulfuritalea sp.]|nr:hypothetical protein [Sulfuritalea sp.]